MCCCVSDARRSRRLSVSGGLIILSTHVPGCENPVPKAFASMFVGNVARQVDATEFGDQVVAETLLIRRQVVELGKLWRKDQNETASGEEEARSTWCLQRPEGVELVWFCW